MNARYRVKSRQSLESRRTGRPLQDPQAVTNSAKSVVVSGEGSQSAGKPAVHPLVFGSIDKDALQRSLSDSRLPEIVLSVLQAIANWCDLVRG